MDPVIKPKLLQRPRGTASTSTAATGTISVVDESPKITGGSIQLLKRTPAAIVSGIGGPGEGELSALSQTVSASSRSNQPSPIPAILSQDNTNISQNSGSSLGNSLVNNKPILPHAILERPKLLTAAGAGVFNPNMLDILRPYCSPVNHSTPLMDPNLRLVTDSMPMRHLIEESKNTKDFFVVCAIGPPGSGKSTALSYLASQEKCPFISENKDDIIFLPRKNDENQQCTFYVSSNRTIFIELAPVFSGSTAVNFIGLVQQFGTIEAATVTWNLRLVRWALSVSHLVLLFSDGVADPNLIQLINAAEMIQPVESAFGEGIYPEIILVCNKVPISSFPTRPESGSKTQNRWDYLFRSLTGKIPRVSSNSNVIILPHNKFNFGFEEHRFEALKKALDEWDRYNRAPFKLELEGKPKIPQNVTITDWNQICSKCWEEMQQSFFSSYLQSYLKFFP